MLRLPNWRRYSLIFLLLLVLCQEFCPLDERNAALEVDIMTAGDYTSAPVSHRWLKDSEAKSILTFEIFPLSDF